MGFGTVEVGLFESYFSTWVHKFDGQGFMPRFWGYFLKAVFGDEFLFLLNNKYRSESL